MATGRKNGLEPRDLRHRGRDRFDLERLNELHVTGRARGGSAGAGHRARPPVRRRVVAAGAHPRLGPHVHHQATDFLCAIETGDDVRPSFADGLAVQRMLAAIEESAAGSGAGRGIEKEA